MNHISLKEIHVDKPSHWLRRTCFDRYQAPLAALGWLGDENCYICISCTECSRLAWPYPCTVSSWFKDLIVTCYRCANACVRDSQSGCLMIMQWSGWLCQCMASVLCSTWFNKVHCMIHIHNTHHNLRTYNSSHTSHSPHIIEHITHFIYALMHTHAHTHTHTHSPQFLFIWHRTGWWRFPL